MCLGPLRHQIYVNIIGVVGIHLKTSTSKQRAERQKMRPTNLLASNNGHKKSGNRFSGATTNKQQLLYAHSQSFHCVFCVLFILYEYNI
jgi:hypothetical protein